jgi:hypothetical protein
LSISSRDVVTLDELAGSICVQLQIGVVSSGPVLLHRCPRPELIQPHRRLVDRSGGLPPRFLPVQLLRFVTSATGDFGSLLTLSPPVGAFSFLQAAVAQIELAVLVARLLGLHLAHIRGPGSDTED